MSIALNQHADFTLDLSSDLSSDASSDVSSGWFPSGVAPLVGTMVCWVGGRVGTMVGRVGGRPLLGEGLPVSITSLSHWSGVPGSVNNVETTRHKSLLLGEGPPLVFACSGVTLTKIGVGFAMVGFSLLVGFGLYPFFKNILIEGWDVVGFFL